MELIDTKSWIQTIPNLEDSKFLFYESKSKYYGFLLNFYKKRFMHIDLKAYLGNVNSRSSNINIFIDNDKRLFNDEVHFFDHQCFGLILSIILMATAATLISNWIKKYKWIAWVGLIAILIVAIDLIYTDIKLFL